MSFLFIYFLKKILYDSASLAKLYYSILYSFNGNQDQINLILQVQGLKKKKKSSRIKLT